jgi:hypothetical protein
LYLIPVYNFSKMAQYYWHVLRGSSDFSFFFVI